MKKFLFFIIVIVSSSVIFGQDENVCFTTTKDKLVTNQAKNNLLKKDNNKSITELTYVNNEMNGLIGMIEEYTFNSFAFYPSASLTPYVDQSLSEISVCINNTASVIYSLKVCIWTDTSGHGSNPVYSQEVTNIQDGWNNVVLNTAYTVTSTPIFIGYTINAKGNSIRSENYSADAETNGYGDMLQYANSGKLLHLSLLGLGDLGIKAYVGSPDPIDAKLLSIDINNSVPIGLTEIKGVLKNVGTEAITSYDVVYKINNGTPSDIYTVSNINILSGETIKFSHNTPYDFATIGSQKIELEISNVNAGAETTTTDNKLIKSILVYPLEDAAGYTENFTPEPTSWTIIDANDDDKTWFLRTSAEFGHGDQTAFRSNYSNLNNADDYLISKALKFEKGKTYTIKFWYKVGTSNGTPTGTAYTEKLKLLIGKAPTIDALSNEIIDLGEVKNPVYKSKSADFSVSEDGNYYIGFYTYSEKEKFYVAVDDISITAKPAIINDINNYKIFPNPTAGVVKINNCANCNIIVYNLIGEKIYETFAVNNKISIDLSAYKQGNYLIKIIDKNKATTKKIVIIK